MFSDNLLFKQWRDELESRGVTIRWLWSTKTDPKLKYDNLALASFCGNGFSPNESTAVIQNYGPRDGFGVWLQSRIGDIKKEADHIAKPR